jgi:hypothetical protein
MNGGPGRSVQDVYGTEDQEDRGKQDTGQRAPTSPFAEVLSQTAPSTNKAGGGGIDAGAPVGEKMVKPKSKR